MDINIYLFYLFERKRDAGYEGGRKGQFSSASLFPKCLQWPSLKLEAGNTIPFFTGVSGTQILNPALFPPKVFARKEIELGAEAVTESRHSHIEGKYLNYQAK